MNNRKATGFDFGLFLSLLSLSILCNGQNANDKKKLVEDVPTPGALCAIKKAYQFTDLLFTPLDSICANPEKEYEAGKEYNGLIYSSVKETDTFVGIDVSLHTFMTALHNPRSVVYTEDVSKPPYHGVNSRAYYGVVCNTFVSYALGLRVSKSTFDFSTAENMMRMEDQSSKGVRLADVIYEKGHVMLVTRIIRDASSGKAAQLEISEAKRPGCRRYMMPGEELDENIKAGKWCLYRYMYLEKNTYAPWTDFVAVGDEKLTQFKYNDVICTNRGDKACFIQGDTVTLNVTGRFRTIEIYKDSVLYSKFRVGRNKDILLAGLPYGDYQARVRKFWKRSDYTYWKVIDTHVDVDVENKEVSFSSANAEPVYLEFCDISGVRPTEGVFELTERNVRDGRADVSGYKIPESRMEKGMYVKVHFECDYGRVINRPVKWE